MSVVAVVGRQSLLAEDLHHVPDLGAGHGAALGRHSDQRRPLELLVVGQRNLVPTAVGEQRQRELRRAAAAVAELESRRAVVPQVQPGIKRLAIHGAGHALGRAADLVYALGHRAIHGAPPSVRSPQKGMSLSLNCSPAGSPSAPAGATVRRLPPRRLGGRISMFRVSGLSPADWPGALPVCDLAEPTKRNCSMMTVILLCLPPSLSSQRSNFSRPSM